MSHNMKPVYINRSLLSASTIFLPRYGSSISSKYLQMVTTATAFVVALFIGTNNAAASTLSSFILIQQQPRILVEKRYDSSCFFHRQRNDFDGYLLSSWIRSAPFYDRSNLVGQRSYLSFRSTAPLFGRQRNNNNEENTEEVSVSRNRNSSNNKGQKTRILKSKGNVPSKICVVCQRPFTWRKKWERSWDEVTCCSNQCNALRRQQQKQQS